MSLQDHELSVSVVGIVIVLVIIINCGKALYNHITQKIRFEISINVDYIEVYVHNKL